MPQLDILAITFTFPVPNRDVERQLTHTPITAHITLPNLRYFGFRGVSAYLEAILCRITTLRLESLFIQLFQQLTFSVPRLTQFTNTIENLRSDNVQILFNDKEIYVGMSFREADTDAFFVKVDGVHLDWQISSVAQISNALSQAFSAVQYLSLEHEVHSQSSEEHNDVDRTEWRNLLKSFSNVKTLRVEVGSSKNSLVVYGWRTESSHWRYCRKYRSSHILEAAIPLMHLPLSLMPAGTQAAL
jgi:hypothetical protein